MGAYITRNGLKAVDTVDRPPNLFLSICVGNKNHIGVVYIVHITKRLL